MYLESEEKHRFPRGGQCMLINLLGQFNFQHGAFPLSSFFLFFFFTFLPVNPPLFLLSFPRESITANDLLTHFAGRHSPLTVLRIFLRKSMRSIYDATLPSRRGKKILSRSCSYNFLKDRTDRRVYTAMNFSFRPFGRAGKR